MLGMAACCPFPVMVLMHTFRRPRRLIRCLSAALLSLGLVLVPLASSWASQSAVSAGAGLMGPELRKAPGPSPQQTIDNVLSLGGHAEAVLADAIHTGLAEPGWTFSPAIHRRADAAQEALQQASHALDLSDVPQVLRPMTGVAELLRLYSLLRYDLSRHPGLSIPDLQQVKADTLTVWSLPDSPISLRQIPANRSGLPARQSGCGQCSAGDFLFTTETLAQLPSDFEKVFAGHPDRRRRFGADLFQFWALLPGGALPPKWFFKLPHGLRHALLTPIGGQSLLQWLLLVPVTLAGLVVLAWWLWRLRGWHREHYHVEGARIHLLRAAGLLPPLVLVWLWRWYAVDWVNLYGARQAAVLIGETIASGFLLATLIYLVAEAIGQQIIWQVNHHPSSERRWVRRRGSGQIMTLARIAGLVLALLVLIRTGRDVGITSVTLLALSSVPALAISLGTQQLIHDIADGFSLLLDGQIKPGLTFIIGTPKSGELQGRIVSLGMRSVRLELSDGSIVSIPNSQVASSVVTSVPSP